MCRNNCTKYRPVRVKLKFVFPGAAKQVCISIKDAITKITLVTRPDPAAPAPVTTNAPNTAVRAVLQR